MCITHPQAGCELYSAVDTNVDPVCKNRDLSTMTRTPLLALDNLPTYTRALHILSTEEIEVIIEHVKHQDP